SYDLTYSYDPPCCHYFFLVQSWFDEFPHVVKYVWKGNYETQDNGYLDVRYKLFFDLKCLYLEVGWRKTQSFIERTKHSVREKIGAPGSENDILKNKVFHHKYHYSDDHYTGYSPDDMPAQFFQVIQKRHFLTFVVLFFGDIKRVHIYLV